MNEFELIQALTKELPAHESVFIGPGDDVEELRAAIDGARHRADLIE